MTDGRKQTTVVRNQARMFLIVFVLVLVAIASLPRARAEVIDKIAAVVGKEIITEVELNRAMSMRNTSKTDPTLRNTVLERLINEKMLDQLLSKSKTEVTDEDLSRAIANVLHQNAMTPDQLKAELASKGMKYEDYKKKMESEIRRVKFVNQVIGPQVKITDQDLRDYYQRNQERFRGSQSAHIAQIVMTFEGLATQADFEKLRDTAISISNKANHGTKFEKLARQFSKGPNADKGGDMGMVNLKNLSPEIVAAIHALRPGETSPPIPTENAIIIVKLVSLPEIRPEDFDRMRDDIYSALYDERIKDTMDGYLQKERQKAFVEIR